MAKTSPKIKAARAPKLGVCGYTRCSRCGRPRFVYRKFDPCHVCLRELVLRSEFPGVTKSSW